MESVVEWLPRIGAILTLLIGLIGFFKPRLLSEYVGLQFTRPEAWSEIRVLAGGLNIGVSVGALWFDDPVIYTTLGLAWLCAVAARFYSVLRDGMTFTGSIPYLAFDGVLAFLFLSGCLY